jgi:hypothetical protein
MSNPDKSGSCNAPDGVDPSANPTGASLHDLLGKLREEIKALTLDEDNRDQILAQLEDLAAAHSSPLWMQSYAKFIVAVGEHSAALGFLLRLLLQRLAGQ